MKYKEIPRNIHGVHRTQWKRWTLVGQMVFNKLFEYMDEDRSKFNIAFMAADLTSRGEKNYLKELIEELEK